MATEADMKRWETLTSRISMDNFRKREDAIFKSYNAAEKVLFNKYESAEKALLKKFDNLEKLPPNANKEAKKLKSLYTKMFKDLQSKTISKDKVNKGKALEDDANVKRYGRDAMKGKSFATMRPTAIKAGASRPPTQKNTKS